MKLIKNELLLNEVGFEFGIDKQSFLNKLVLCEDIQIKQDVIAIKDGFFIFLAWVIRSVFSIHNKLTQIIFDITCPSDFDNYSLSCIYKLIKKYFKDSDYILDFSLDVGNDFYNYFFTLSQKHYN